MILHLTPWANIRGHSISRLERTDFFSVQLNMGTSSLVCVAFLKKTLYTQVSTSYDYFLGSDVDIDTFDMIINRGHGVY